jgi:hypothetical protein
MCATEWAQVDVLKIESKLTYAKQEGNDPKIPNRGKFLARLMQLPQAYYVFKSSKIQHSCFLVCEGPLGHVLIAFSFAKCMPNQDQSQPLY